MGVFGAGTLLSGSSGCFQIKKLSSWGVGGMVGGKGLCQAPGLSLLVERGVRQVAAACEMVMHCL